MPVRLDAQYVPKVIYLKKVMQIVPFAQLEHMQVKRKNVLIAKRVIIPMKAQSAVQYVLKAIYQKKVKEIVLFAQ